MTDTIEQKALALIKPGATCEVNLENISILAIALTRAIEAHEAFRQEVSDAMLVLQEFITGSRDHKRGSHTDSVRLADGRSVEFARYIIAKPDPLEKALEETGYAVFPDDLKRLYAAIEKRGGKITWGEG